jgi:hypothetical protein
MTSESTYHAIALLPPAPEISRPERADCAPSVRGQAETVWWTTDQLLAVALPELLFAGLWIGSLVRFSDEMLWMWRTAFGVRFMVGAIFLAAADWGLYLYFLAILNRDYWVHDEKYRGHRALLYRLLIGAHLLIFLLAAYMAAFGPLTIGPTSERPSLVW